MSSVVGVCWSAIYHLKIVAFHIDTVAFDSKHILHDIIWSTSSFTSRYTLRKRKVNQILKFAVKNFSNSNQHFGRRSWVAVRVGLVAKHNVSSATSLVDAFKAHPNRSSSRWFDDWFFPKNKWKNVQLNLPICKPFWHLRFSRQLCAPAERARGIKSHLTCGHPIECFAAALDLSSLRIFKISPHHDCLAANFTHIQTKDARNPKHLSTKGAVVPFWNVSSGAFDCANYFLIITTLWRMYTTCFFLLIEQSREGYDFFQTLVSIGTHLQMNPNIKNAVDSQWKRQQFKCQNFASDLCSISIHFSQNQCFNQFFFHSFLDFFLARRDRIRAEQRQKLHFQRKNRSESLFLSFFFHIRHIIVVNFLSSFIIKFSFIIIHILFHPINQFFFLLNAAIRVSKSHSSHSKDWRWESIVRLRHQRSQPAWLDY